MHRLFCLLLLTIVVKAVSYGQTSLFLDVRGNYSAIPTYEKNASPNPTGPIIPVGVVVTYPEYKLIESYHSKPGIDLLLGINHAISGRVSVESGLGFSLVNYKKEVTIENEVGSEPSFIINTHAGLPIATYYGPLLPGNIKYIDADSLGTNRLVLGNLSNEGKTRLLYLSIPVNVNYMVIDNRLAVGCGFSASILVLSRQSTSQIHFSRYYEINNDILDRWGTDGYPVPSITQITVTETVDKSGSGLNNVIWSGNVQVQYRFFKNTWVNAGVQQGFTSIYVQDDGYRSPAKNRLLKLGLRYYLAI